jgi:DNA helicase-2/ATP-dependent DNA helicase PcrA
MGFTEEQAALITEPGHALALAGPGSGKTSTVIEKIARLLQHKGNSVVAASFSREGAEEIRRRLGQRMGEEKMMRSEIQIGTFHALIADHRKKNFRSAKMLSPAHQTRTLASAARESNLTYGAVIDEFEGIKYALIPPEEATLPAWYINYEQHLRTLHSIDLQDLIRVSVLQMGMGVKLPEVAWDMPPSGAELSMPLKLAYAVKRYKADLRVRCEKLKAQTKDHLSNGRQRDAEASRQEMQQVIANEGVLPLFKATHLVIDESQDNDELQFALATLHALSGVQTTLIGDDDQTIYEWRQAMGYPGLMSFAKTFGARIITLGANFRSLRSIVESADKLIRHNDGHRIEKVFESRRGHGGSVEARAVKTTAQMADYAAEFIYNQTSAEISPNGQWHRHAQTGEFAVLARSNKHLDRIEDQMVAKGVKYVRRGSSLFSREGAQHVYDILGGVYAADIKGISIMLQLMRVHTSIADKLCRMIKGQEVNFVNGLMTNFAQFGASAAEAEECCKWFSNVRRLAIEGKHPEVIGEVCEKVRGIYYIKGEYVRTDEANVHSVRAAQKALTRMKGPVLSRVATLRNVDGKDSNEKAVMLLTFHGSKGLEFKQVVIVGADEKTVPGSGEIMSERRLFYVAVTRAKDAVLITYSGQPSRYIYELGAI